ncbi:pyridoxal phosphate-dependent aminotransferase (plasmid) [Providencia sp. R33]|uniref:MalY/PatB family protein n=1 Tax=Providencia sp. R33 TaxID=2828763 RepID=UPI001C5A9B1E|nr:pyridoxal phosphate-dependent aminotransferase [Providencia sp. R33]
MTFDFDTLIDRTLFSSTKWTYPNDPLYTRHQPTPLWVADMDFQSPPSVRKALLDVINYGVLGYTNCPESTFEAIVDWQKIRHLWDIQTDWIIQSPGVVTAIDIMINALTEPNDAIIIMPPVYGAFARSITANQRTVIPVPLNQKNNLYSLDFNQLESQITAKTKLLILCHPHNPVGKIWTVDELKHLGDICLKYNILIISDEIHQDLIFNHRSQYRPFASIHPDYAEYSMICTSPSKTFNLAGLQTSNIIIKNNQLRNRIKKEFMRYDLSRPNMLGLAACEAAYRTGQNWLDSLLIYLRNNHYLLHTMLNNVEGIQLTHSDALFLSWIDFRQTKIDILNLNSHLIQKGNVWLDMGDKFGNEGQGFARLNFACSKTLLLSSIKNILSSIQTESISNNGTSKNDYPFI